MADVRNGVLRRNALPAVVFASVGGRHRPCGHVPRRRADGRRRRAGLPPSAARVARDAGHGAAEHRRLGTARGSDRMGVRCSGTRRGSWRRDRRRVRRHGARREPSGRGRARRGVGSSRPRLENSVAEAGRLPAGEEPRMRERPYTLLSCCVSIDGYIGNAASRLLLSNDADFDRVDAVRASCDAILVGAETVRIDNPRLLVRSEARREERAARGLPESPMKVTVTRRAELDARADFFNVGDTREDRLLREPVGGRRARSTRPGRDRRRRRRQRRDARAQHRPGGARRRPVDGRGRRRRSTRSSSRTTSSTSCS